MSGPPEKEVRRWIGDVEAERNDLAAQLAPLLERQAAVEERLGILRRLLASLVSPGTDEANGAQNGQGPDGERTSSIRERVIRDAAEILRAATKPMHINELHAEFIKRGYEIPGAGKPVNITVHLSGAESIASPTRGYYTLMAAHATPSRQAVRDDTRGHRS